jgi:hypothetical protein
MAKATELVSLLKDQSDDPRYAVCYARGIFRKEGNFWRVEKGKRTLVLRTLCVLRYHGAKCALCPNVEFQATFVRPHGSLA